MARLLLTGGRQRDAVALERLREWHLYDEARVLELDTETGEVRVRLEYRTPPGLCPAERPSHVFKSASVDGDRVLAVTQTEVLVLDRATLALRERVSHPTFNDLHHVARIGGRLHVVSTGLDRLVVLDEAGEPADHRHALGGAGEAAAPLDPSVDWRLVPSTKPHASHPNFVFATAEGVWLTRLEQQDAVCLDRPGLRIELGRKPHDGVVREDGVWFTTVDGHLVRADPATGAVELDLDLHALSGSDVPLGWCRGLRIEEGIAYVGFSRIRYTSARKNLSWVRHGFRLPRGYTARPTRIAAWDLAARRLVAEWDLEPYGLNAVFGVLPAEA